jgi:hypothetical protein
MGDARDIVVRALPGVTPDQARDARAKALFYAFECFHRRNAQKGGTATAPNDAMMKQIEGVDHVERRPD